MKRFRFSEKLKEKARAPVPTEIERPTERKEPVLRRWLIRGISLLVVILLFYILFKDVFVSEVDGLIEPEKITVQAPTDGTVITFFSEGDTVPPNKTIAKIYNPEIEESIKSLKDTIAMLLKWKEELKAENERRKLDIKQSKELTKFSLLVSAPTREELARALSALKQKEASLIEEREVLKEEIRKLQKLIEVGAATRSELTLKLKQLTSVEAAIADLKAKMSQLYARLKVLNRERPPVDENVEINPLLPQLQSVDYQIASLKSTLEKLTSKLDTAFISLPFAVKISQIVPSGSFVSKGTQVLSAVRMDKFIVTAFVDPKDAKKIRIKDRVTVILPTGEKIKGEVIKFEPTLVLKPAVLVGPLEKRTLVLPVRIKILEEKEVRKIAYENMPVTVVFNNL